MHSPGVTYLDNNATTRPAPEVVAAMRPYLEEWYGNPSSVHRFGQRARMGIDVARGQIAELVGCAEGELMFTGGGTEAVNTAIRGLLMARGPRRKIVTSTVEHSATREFCGQLAKDGLAEIVEIGVDTGGRLDLDRLMSVLGTPDDVALVTLLWANNETGVLFPIAEIARACRERRVPLHCDGTQAVGKIPVSVAAIGVDAMSFASHKFHGPKGVGALFARRGLRLRPTIVGGPQERGRRGGTENVPGIVGMGRAAELAKAWLALGEGAEGAVPRAAEAGEFASAPGQVRAMRDRLEAAILGGIGDTAVNGVEPRLPNTTNIAFSRLEAEAILLLLSEQDVCASAGAACASGSLEPSHVLRAMRIDPKLAHGAIRFSLSRYTTEADVDAALEILPGIVDRLRAVLPVG